MNSPDPAHVPTFGPVEPTGLRARRAGPPLYTVQIDCSCGTVLHARGVQSAVERIAAGVHERHAGRTFDRCIHDVPVQQPCSQCRVATAALGRAFRP